MSAVTLASIRANFSDTNADGSVTGATVQQLLDFLGGSVGTNATVSGLWQHGGEGILQNAPGVVGTIAPSLVSNVIAFTAAPRLYTGRVVIPRAGTLYDLAIAIGTSSGNVSVAVYDTGDTTAGTYTRLYTSGAVACPSGSAWQIIGNPSLSVYEGQQLLFALSCDNTTATFGEKGIGTSYTLPTNFMPCAGGNLPKTACLSTAGTPHPCPATITEANLSNTNVLFAIIGRLV